MLNQKEVELLNYAIVAVKNYIASDHINDTNESIDVLHDIHLRLIHTLALSSVKDQQALNIQYIINNIGAEISQLIQGNYPVRLRCIALTIYAVFIPFFPADSLQNIVNTFEPIVQKVENILNARGLNTVLFASGDFVNLVRVFDSVGADDIYFYMASKQVVDIARTTLIELR